MSNKYMTQSQTIANIAQFTELSNKDVKAVLEALAVLAGDQLKCSHCTFVVPWIVKLVAKKKPATKAHKGKNPFTGEEIMVKAKPASRRIVGRPVKALKDAVAD